MSKYRLNSRDVSRSVFLVASILILLGSIVTTEASVYSSLIMQSQITVSSPEVILQNGTAGTSTIYTNNTSAKVSVDGLNWLQSWEKRVKITINSSDIDEALTDFPILIYLSNGSSGENSDDVSFIFDEIRSSRKKIAVTTSDGTTQCYVEIEKWNDASEQAWLWVRIPNISNNTDTNLYLYYDSNHADNTIYVGDVASTPAQNVWNNNFSGIWHLSEGGTGTRYESTSHGNNGTTSGYDGDEATTWKIDGSDDLEGNDDYIYRADANLNGEIPCKSSGAATSFTISAWINIDKTGYRHPILVKQSDGSGTTRGFMFNVAESNVLNIEVWKDNSNPTFTSSAGTLDQDTWYHVIASYNFVADGVSEVRLYINGSNDGSNDLAVGPLATNDRELRIGCYYWSASYNRYFDGAIDEIRISNDTRSASWIKASYESERDDLLDFGSEEVAWYDINWNCRKKITIDYTKVEADLNDFPILVNITDAGLRDYAQSDGDDILFAASDGTTKLSHEIEMFNGTTGQLMTWVKANISATISTVLYVYYDNPSASNQENIPDVWSNGYVAVWHLHDVFDDSTSNNYDWSNYGSVDVLGKIADGQEFNPHDGSADRIELGNWSVSGNHLTIQTWVKFDDFDQDDPRVITKAQSGSEQGHVFMLSLTNGGNGDNRMRMRLKTGTSDISGTTTLIADSSGDLTANEWHLLAATYDGTYMRLIKNGDEVGNSAKNGDLRQNSWEIWAGNNPGYTTTMFSLDGKLDEIRISSVDRSTSWLKTEYNNQYNSSSFHSIGIKEEKPTIKYDYVLRVNNTITDAWQIRLKKYADSNISRLQDCTIYFHNSTDGTSSQIVIENGLFINETGPWYDLGSLETIYIAMTVEANSTGTSYVYTYLEIRIPGTTTYLQYIITFEIT